MMEAEKMGLLLPSSHKEVQAVKNVGLRIAEKASDGFGGGFNKHMQASPFHAARPPSTGANELGCHS